MRYLIAGGAGFIGSHLTERFVRNGAEVTVIDNLVTGNKNNLRNVLSRIEFFESDIADFDTDMKYDAVFHLAAIANTYDYIKNRYDVLKSSSFGTDRLLKIAEKSAAEFYYFSSSEVYGHICTDKDTTICEKDLFSVATMNERSPYFVGKMFSEEYVKAFCEKKCLKHMIIRPFNVYGTRMDSRSEYGRVMTNFFRLASSAQPLVINGDGEQTRSFCHVDDFVDAVISLIKARPWKYNVVNIGNPETININTLAGKISSFFGEETRIEKASPVMFEPRYRRPNIDRIYKMTGWKPKINIDDGLSDVFLKEHSNR